MPTATAADEFKYQFFLAIQNLMATNPDTPYVLVTYGLPGTLDPDDMIIFGGLQSNQTHGPMGTQRSREETLTLDIDISCYRGGGQDQELVAAQRAFQLLRMIETYARQTDTTINGTVRHCFLIAHQTRGTTDPTIVESGRVMEISAQFLAHARVTG